MGFPTLLFSFYADNLQCKSKTSYALQLHEKMCAFFAHKVVWFKFVCSCWNYKVKEVVLGCIYFLFLSNKHALNWWTHRLIYMLPYIDFFLFSVNKWKRELPTMGGPKTLGEVLLLSAVGVGKCPQFFSKIQTL